MVEALANECYRMDLRGEPQQRVWAYRKAAWAIEDLPALAGRPGEQDVGLIYWQMGRHGLESIRDVGPRLAEVVEGLIQGTVGKGLGLGTDCG